MKLEDQVTSLELSKKLKELGVKQDSLWYWMTGHEKLVSKQYFGEETMLKKDLLRSAFTVAELGEMLPTPAPNDGGDIECVKFEDKWVITWPHGTWIEDKTEANARAKALIWLIENGHVNVKDL